MIEITIKSDFATFTKKISDDAYNNFKEWAKDDIAYTVLNDDEVDELFDPADDADWDYVKITYNLQAQSEQ